MRRRAFLAALAALASAPARGERTGGRVVAVLTPSEAQWEREAFLVELARLGFGPEQGVRTEVVSAEGQLRRLPDLARTLAARSPELVVAVNTPGTQAALEALPSRPIVAAIVGDPAVAIGAGANLARPGGTVTGVTNLSTELTAKRLSILTEAVPNLRRVALFLHPQDPIVALQIAPLEQAAQALGISLTPYPMRTVEQLASAVGAARQAGTQAVLRLVGQAFSLAAETGRAVTEAGLPAMLVDRESVLAGGLMAYNAAPRDLWRRVAGQVARILGGTPPADIPFEQPTTFELIVNLTAARRLGLTLPPALLARADEVIE
jgi:putative tryptophan/tyrosine transport system substrate-binding protein